MLTLRRAADHAKLSSKPALAAAAVVFGEGKHIMKNPQTAKTG